MTNVVDDDLPLFRCYKLKEPRMTNVVDDDLPQTEAIPEAVKEPKRRGRPPKRKAVPTPDFTTIDGLSEPGVTSTGEPAEHPDTAHGDGKKRGRRSKKEEIADDTKDLQDLVAQAYALIAAASGEAFWKLTEQEAGAIARPLARILNRNSKIDKMVRTIVDPVALGAAILVPTGQRLRLQAMSEAAKRARPVTVAPPAQESRVRYEATSPAPPQPDMPTPSEGSPDRVAVTPTGIVVDGAALELARIMVESGLL